MTNIQVKDTFSNGGLFQAIENYDWENTDFEIPNDFWFNDKRNWFTECFISI